MASVTQLKDGIYRLSIWHDKIGMSFSQFLIADAQPTLIETGYRKDFEETRRAIAEVLDPSTLRFVVVPHFEGDECGALNEILRLAPRAQPVTNRIGAMTSIADFAIASPYVAQEGDVLDLGRHKLRIIMAPFVHAWESLVVYEETEQVLFSSDFLGQYGVPDAISDADLTGRMKEFVSPESFPSDRHIHALVAKIEALPYSMFAPMHGAALTAHHAASLRAMKELRFP
ncbi:MAG: MBL fold metallo-hydrolase [Candidatus Tectomicrobia bacterium]|nr:MBL fold metallo-hydrolase [Candidatus Tectomicrobia bacterium]